MAMAEMSITGGVRRRAGSVWPRRLAVTAWQLPLARYREIGEYGAEAA